MTKNEIYRNYLRDLVFILKEDYAKLKADSKKDEFNSGLEFGHYTLIELIESQALAFNIDLNDFGFFDFEKSSENVSPE